MMVSASDVITYAGVPLAVVGVLPSLYTFVRSIVTLRQVRRILDENGVEAMTRGSMLSGIIEVEMPRKGITPLDRDDPQYFEKSKRTSDLKGGSWTLFDWRELVIGIKVLRLQYHDELVVPQAEVELEPLVAFLLDRGAEIDLSGWAGLRSSGLWTPIATRLLVAPDGSGQPILSVAGSEDSEGMLSLKLAWRPEWNLRGIDDLPPYWMSLDGPEVDQEVGLGIALEKLSDEGKEPEVKEELNKKSVIETTDIKPPIQIITTPPTAETDGLLCAPSSSSSPSPTPLGNRRLSTASILSLPHNRSSSRLTTHSCVTTAFTTTNIPTHGSLRLKLCPSGVDQILLPDSNAKIRPRHLRQFGVGVTATSRNRSTSFRNNSNNNGPSASFNSATLWFSTAATAIAAPHGGLWSFAVPPAIIAFAHVDSIPCGILELWGILSDTETPMWRAPIDNKLAEIEQHQRDEMGRVRRMKEAQLKGDAWTKAVHERFAEERRERRFADERRELERKNREGQVMVEALRSARLSPHAVGEACRRYLVKQSTNNAYQSESESEEQQAKGAITEHMSISRIVELVLWQMVLHEEVAWKVAEVLDMWKHWADNGGMTEAQHDEMKGNLVAFSYAACIVSVIAESAESMEGNMVSDLQECMRLWKRVRLG